MPSAAKAECGGVADVGELCWVCFAGAGPGEGGQLFSPCTVCRGSLRSLHRACFYQWLVSSWALACPNCARGYSRDVLEGLVEGRMLLQVLDGLLQGQAELAPPAAPPAEPLPPSAALPGDRVAEGWGAVSSSSGHATRAHHDQGGSGSSGSTAPDPATHPIPGSAEVVSGREGVGAGARGRGGGGGVGEGASRLHPDVWQQRFPEGTEVVFTLAQAVQVSLPAEQLTVPGVMRAIRGVMESLAHPGSSVLLADGRPLQLDPSALTYDSVSDIVVIHPPSPPLAQAPAGPAPQTLRPTPSTAQGWVEGGGQAEEEVEEEEEEAMPLLGDLRQPSFSSNRTQSHRNHLNQLGNHAHAPSATGSGSDAGLDARGEGGPSATSSPTAEGVSPWSLMYGFPSAQQPFDQQQLQHEQFQQQLQEQQQAVIMAATGINAVTAATIAASYGAGKLQGPHPTPPHPTPPHPTPPHPTPP
ncbi:hypothetical protein QJQ45_027462, partial [Haematococcus lacustris]